MRFLYKCRITKQSDSYNIYCKPNNSTNAKEKNLVFRGSEDSFKLFLRRIQAKDAVSEPASVKSTTYGDMISHGYFYAWNNMLPSNNVIKEEKENNVFFESNKSAQEWIDESIYKE